LSGDGAYAAEAFCGVGGLSLAGELGEGGGGGEEDEEESHAGIVAEKIGFRGRDIFAVR
jgi:hypothetical protein